MNFRDQYQAIFGEEYIEQRYKFKAHSFTKRVAGKQYCSNCGLVSLNNDFTRWAVRMGCYNEAHPGYKSQRKKASLIKC